MISKFELMFEDIMRAYDDTKVKGGSVVTVDKEALKNPDIRKEITSKKGQAYLAQLEKMADDGIKLYVSALKIVRPTSAFIAETHPTNFEEADVVNQKHPGCYSSPMTVPTTILKMIADPSNVMQVPLDKDLEYDNKISKSKIQDDSYNKGEQPEGTRKGKGKKDQVVNDEKGKISPKHESTDLDDSDVIEEGFKNYIVCAYPDHKNGGEIMYYCNNEINGKGFFPKAYDLAKRFDTLEQANGFVRKNRDAVAGHELKSKRGEQLA